MNFLELKSKRMEVSQVWAFVAECLQRNDINMSIKAALRACLKILFEHERRIPVIRCAQEFLGCLEQLFGFSVQTGLIMALDYYNESHQLVYSYGDNCSAWIFSCPLWSEPSYLPQTCYPNCVGTMQPRRFGYAYPVAWQVPRHAHTATSNYLEMVKCTCGNCIKSKCQAPESSIFQPNKSMRCENWPTITQGFWPTREAGVKDLIRKHGPINTWYASSEQLAPPASALPIPSFVSRRRAPSVATSSSCDSEFFSSDESSTSTNPTSQCASSDLYNAWVGGKPSRLGNFSSVC